MAKTERDKHHHPGLLAIEGTPLAGGTPRQAKNLENGIARAREGQISYRLVWEKVSFGGATLEGSRVILRTSRKMHVLEKTYKNELKGGT